MVKVHVSAKQRRELADRILKVDSAPLVNATIAYIANSAATTSGARVFTDAKINNTGDRYRGAVIGTGVTNEVRAEVQDALVAATLRAIDAENVKVRR